MPDKPSIDFNLDTFERENAPEPFYVILGGKRYALQDAQALDYRDLLDSQRKAMNGEPERAVEILVPEEDRDAFFANRIPNFKLDALFRRYNEHHGLPTPGESSGSSAS
jgi:hypothetical protein